VKLKHKNLAVFAVAILLTVVVGIPISIYYTAPTFYNLDEKAIQKEGVGGAPIPINTLYTEPSLPTSNTSGFVFGVNHDTLYTVAVLDLSPGPEVLHVPEIGRYYDVEFVDTRGDDFAYVGTRTTGSQAGNFLISGPGWHGAVPAGVTQIASPDNKVLLLGRVLVENDSDVSTAYNLSTQITLTPLSDWQSAAG
jgi:hypothetical protein